MRDYFAELWSFAVGCYGEKFRGGCDDNTEISAGRRAPPPPRRRDVRVMRLFLRIWEPRLIQNQLCNRLTSGLADLVRQLCQAWTRICLVRIARCGLRGKRINAS